MYVRIYMYVCMHSIYIGRYVFLHIYTFDMRVHDLNWHKLIENTRSHCDWSRVSFSYTIPGLSWTQPLLTCIVVQIQAVTSQQFEIAGQKVYQAGNGYRYNTGSRFISEIRSTGQHPCILQPRFHYRRSSLSLQSIIHVEHTIRTQLQVRDGILR